MAKSKAVYLHEQQRAFIRRLSGSWLWRSEFPTWVLIVVIYGGWFATLACHETLGLLPATVLLIWFTAWYCHCSMSLFMVTPRATRGSTNCWG